MIRTLMAVTCLAAALLLVVGCSQSGAGGGPKLANPDNTVFKDVQKKTPAGGAGGPKGGVTPQ